MSTVSLSLPFRGQYVVTQPYGVTSNTFELPGHGHALWHQGIDFATPCGTQLYAAGDGAVYVDQPELYNNDYGANLVTIDHGQGVTSLYGHLSQKTVATGQIVKRGDPIGLSGGGMGNRSIDGNSTGCHLHFGVLLDGWHDQDLDLLTDRFRFWEDIPPHSMCV